MVHALLSTTMALRVTNRYLQFLFPYEIFERRMILYMLNTQSYLIITNVTLTFVLNTSLAISHSKHLRPTTSAT